jgi:hypothetical protein
MDSRTNPLNPNQIGDDSSAGEIAGELKDLKMTESTATPLPGSLDYAHPDTSPTEDPNSDPGLMRGSRDPSPVHSDENDNRPEDARGDTPYDAQGTAGSEGG